MRLVGGGAAARALKKTKGSGKGTAPWCARARRCVPRVRVRASGRHRTEFVARGGGGAARLELAAAPNCWVSPGLPVALLPTRALRLLAHSSNRTDSSSRAATTATHGGGSPGRSSPRVRDVGDRRRRRWRHRRGAALRQSAHQRRRRAHGPGAAGAREGAPSPSNGSVVAAAAAHHARGRTRPSNAAAPHASASPRRAPTRLRSRRGWWR